MTLRARAGFEWKNSRTKIFGEELYDDRLRTVEAGISFNAFDRWDGYNLLDVSYSQGLDLFGIRDEGSPDLSRDNGDPLFSKIEFTAARLQSLPRQFQFLAMVTGQHAFNPLLSSEEFGFGGAQAGRGYDSSEITGDHGIGATLELRRPFRMDEAALNLMLEPYAFFDIGKVWNIDEGSGGSISAASAGAGMRASLKGGWNADLNAAVPLTKTPDKEPKYQNDTGFRVLFSLTKSF